MFINKVACCILLCMMGLQPAWAQNNILVMQSDFGLKDGAVAAMKGVAIGVSNRLQIFDLTHEIPPFNIWEAAYRLEQTAPYWPAGTVFVSVVDPGVGSQRKSVVLLTRDGQYFVTPDNGTLTLIAKSKGIAAVREIDEAANRRPGSGASYTFYGRDVYAYTAARLAAGVIPFEAVGPLLAPQVVAIPYQQAMVDKDTLKGNIPILDVQYGNVWTNIDAAAVAQLNIRYGDTVQVTILHNRQVVYAGSMPYVPTFSAVGQGRPLCYLNSLMQVSFALNEASFSNRYKVYSGAGWQVHLYRKKT